MQASSCTPSSSSGPSAVQTGSWVPPTRSTRADGSPGPPHFPLLPVTLDLSGTAGPPPQLALLGLSLGLPGCAGRAGSGSPS